MDTLSDDIRTNKKSLVREKKPPDLVLQPLPRDKQLALPILFFLHMPADLKLLARMAISAQQILCPVETFRKGSALHRNAMAEIR